MSLNLKSELLFFISCFIIFEKSLRELLGVLGDENCNLQRRLKNVSSWLKVPIYVCDGIEKGASMNVNQCCRWNKYEPDSYKTDSCCRFYVTLFHNKAENYFDRITPLESCNCQIASPLSLLRSGEGKLNIFNILLYWCKNSKCTP